MRAPQGYIGLGEALDLTATALKIPGWRGWTWELPIFQRAKILAIGDQEIGGEEALEAAVKDSRNFSEVMTRAGELLYGTPPLHEDAVPTLVIDARGRPLLIPVEEWRRAGTWQLFVRRRWAPRHEAPAFAIFVHRNAFGEALARTIGAPEGEAPDARPLGRLPRAKDRKHEAEIRARIQAVHAAARRRCAKKGGPMELAVLAEALKGTAGYRVNTIRAILNGTYRAAKRRGFGPFEWRRPKR
jgi:hypothetical protein